MKKILIRILSVALLFTCVFSFSACEKTIKQVTVNIDNVSSNGGPIAKSGNVIYFVNGFLKATSTSNKYGTVGVSSIYKLALGEDGKITTDDDGNIQNMSQLVSSQVGFAKGSIYTFGEYVYYATPYEAKDKNGLALYNYLSFYRIKNDGSERTLLFTTETDDSNMIYTYYITGEDELTLVLFEKDSKILTSYIITNKVEKLALDTEVSSVVLSDTNGTGEDINKYVYYTKSVTNDDEIQQGNKVYRIMPNGSDKTLISTGRNIDIVTICNNNLVYVENNTTYITKLTNNLLTSQDTKISEVQYSNAYYLADGTSVSMIVVDTTISDNTKIKFVPGSDYVNNHILYEGSATIIGVSGDNVIFYNKDNYIYKVNYKIKDSSAIKICSKEVSAQEGNMIIEIIDNYVYFFGTLTLDNDVKYTMLYRTDITNTKEESAELIGKSK